MKNNKRKKTKKQFEVEGILRKRVTGDRTEYLIKWLNFSDEDNTWEPAENLSCRELVEEFEEANSQNDDCIVEAVIAKRFLNNTVEYLIKWHGYGDEDNTWEPIEHLSCDKMLQEFEIKYDNECRQMAHKDECKSFFMEKLGLMSTKAK